MATSILFSVFIAGLGVLTVAETYDTVSSTHFLSDAYIAKINAEQDQWQAGRNFDPKTPLSDIKILLGTRMDNRDASSISIKISDPAWPEKEKIPRHFDARRKWGKKCPTIGEVLDQGKCGSCWAISAAQAFSDRYCIATKGKHKARLSTSQVMTCCSKCGYGCSGGWEIKAWTYFGETGLVSGGDYNSSVGCQPYSIPTPCRHYNEHSPYPQCPKEHHKTPQCNMSCTNSKYPKRFDKDKRYANLSYKVQTDETSIKREIMKYGPVTAAFVVREDFLNYKKGVYEPSENAKPIGGHAVKLMGWGVQKKVPYWLVMNSWNEYWGDKGCIKMKRNCKKINLEKQVHAAKPRSHK